jgi:MSHA biogenesis protein MshK
VLLVLLCALPGRLAAEALADPTRPPELPAAIEDEDEGDAGGPSLTSIVVSPERRIAVIDGAAVRVGDRVSMGRIVAIEPSSVRLESELGELTLSIAGAAVKSEPDEER